MREFLRKQVIPKLLAWIYFLYASTLRFRCHNLPIHQHPLLFAHWHGDELALIAFYKFKKMVALVSHSKDGDLMAGALKSLGYQVVRGSSSRGGASGLFSLIKTIKRTHCDASLAVDGPKGPRHQVKAGVIKLASSTGLPLYPAVVHTKHRYTFKKSWNQAYLPRPFSVVNVEFGEAIQIPKKASEEEIEKYRFTLEKTLLHLAREEP